MKKITLLVLLLCGVLLTGCYNTRILVGNIKPNEPLVEVNKQWNGHFLFGWIPGKNAKMNPAPYVNNHTDYVIRTYTSFLNGLVGAVTLGIYTPTQTKFYLPVQSTQTSPVQSTQK